MLLASIQSYLQPGVPEVEDMLLTVMFREMQTVLPESPLLSSLQSSNQLSQYDLILLTLPHALHLTFVCTSAALLYYVSDQKI